VKEFLKLGSLAAAATFLPGLRASLLLILVGAAYGSTAATTLGLSAQFLALTIVAVVGLSITTLFRIRRMGAGDKVSDIAVNSGSTAFAGALLIVIVAIISGALIPIVLSDIDAKQFLPYWYISIVSLVAVIFSSWQTGLLQARNADSKVLKIGLISAAASVGSAVVIVQALADDPVLALSLIAISNALIDVITLVSRSRAVGVVWGVELDGTWGRAFKIFWSHKVKAMRTLPEVAKATADGLILMMVFLTAGLVATWHDVEAGAAVLTAVALMRSLVLPLKQFGMVGGRLAVGAGPEKALLLRSMTMVVSAILLAGAGVLVALKVLMILPPTISTTLVVLLALQLLLEPVTGFLFASMKIIHKPDFAMVQLFRISILFTIPGLVVLAVLGLVTPELVWTVLLSARVIFAIVVVLAVKKIGLAGGITHAKSR